MKPGDVVGDRFVVDVVVRHGAMGTLVRAHDRGDDRPVALKILSNADEIALARFHREAIALAELRHPAIVRYVADGVTPAGDPFVAMEWLDGEDLAARLRRAPLGVAESVRLARRVAQALGVAHARGVVHRDVKPSNIFLCSGEVDRAQLIDFGIARWQGVTRTEARGLVGTPGYLAPEQAGGEQTIDARADVFGLGCVLFECVTGRPAFGGDTLMAVLAKTVLHHPPPLREIRGDLPPALEALCAAMLAKDRDARPAHGGEVEARLAALDETQLAELPRESGAAPQLGDAETRLLCVIVVGAADATLAGDELPVANLAALRRTTAEFGGRLDVLGDGSAVVSFAGGGNATGLAVRGARCAAALRTLAPGVPIGVAMGPGSLTHGSAIGPVIERAVALIAAGHEVRLEDTVAGLLETRFAVARDGRGAILGAELRLEERRTLLGKPTPCVGRERELALLESTFEQCAAESLARCVLVTAPAGVGKSRLRHEVTQRLARHAPVALWLARGDPMRAGSTFALVADALRGALGLDAGAGQPQALVDAVARRVGIGERARTTAFLGELLGIPLPAADDAQLAAARADAALMAEQITSAWQTLVAAECAERPLVLVLDDVHWGDVASFRLVDRALRALRDRPLCVLAFGRPELHTQFPGLWAARGVQELKLAELTPRAGQELVRDVLGADAETCARLTAQSGGNAFFLEELIRAVAEGRIQTLPRTVLAIVHARLEALSAEDRKALRAASVFGESFRAEGVAALVGTAPAPDTWHRLEADELIERRSPVEAVWRFRHAFVRDAAYALFTEDERALAHRLAGAHLEERGGADAHELAEHFERGGEPARAVQWLQRAAIGALAASDLDTALARAGRAVELGASGESLGMLRWLEGEVHMWRGDFAAGAQKTAAALLELRPGSLAWYSAVQGGLVTGAQLGDLAGVGELIGAVLAQPPPAAVVGIHARTWSFCLRALTAVGQLDGVPPLEERLAAARGADDRMARVYGTYGQFLRATYLRWNPWDMLVAQMTFERLLQEAADRVNALMSGVHVAWAELALGGYAEAESRLRAVLAAPECPPAVADFARAHLGDALGHQGRLDEAKHELRAAIAGIGPSNPLFGLVALTNLADVHLRCGDSAQAIDQAREAGALSVPLRLPRVRVLATLADALLAAGAQEEAAAAAAEALAILDELGCSAEGEVRARVVLARARRDPAAMAAARDRVLAVAAGIGDAAWRARFLAVPENALALEPSR